MFDLFFHSQDLVVLCDFLPVLGWNLCRDHPGAAAHTEQLQTDLPGQSRPAR